MENKDEKFQVRHAKEYGRVKCPRCWHWEYSLNFDDLCNKCVDIILTDFPNHASVPFILKNLEDRGLSKKDNPVLQDQ